MTASRSNSDNSRKIAAIVFPVVTRFLSAAILLALHVQADNATLGPEERDSLETVTFWERVTTDSCNTLDKILFVALILVCFEILQHISSHLGPWFHLNTIPVRGKHLDVLSSKDHLFIAISKAQTGPFVYLSLRYICFFEPNCLLELSQASLQNVLLPLPFLYLVFDFNYWILHWALHFQSAYGYIHKHHHHQKAPSRANNDAVNVHPIEFILGEYNHLAAIYLVCRILPVHALACLIFVAVGGVLAGLNHTRDNVVLSLFGITLFDSKAHDVHHRFPTVNYGQYTMFWDHVFGTYRAYDENDRINPMAQLDPDTGMSVEYTKTLQKIKNH